MASQAPESFMHYGFLNGPDGGETGPLFEVATTETGAVALRGVDPFDGTPTEEIVAEAVLDDGIVEVDVHSGSVDAPAIKSIVDLIRPEEKSELPVRLVCADEALMPHVDSIAAAGQFATSQAFHQAA